MPITLEHPPIQAPPPQEGASPIQPNANNPFAVSPLWGMLWQLVQQAMQQPDPIWARPPIHEWGAAPVGEGPISGMAEGRYPSEGVTPVPFGHVSDPVSLLATLLAPVFQRGTQGVLSGVQTYRDLASAPQRIAAERAAWAEKTAAWDAEQATFRAKELAQLTGKPLSQQIQWTPRDEAFRQWMQAHYPTVPQYSYTGAHPPDADAVKAELASIIQARGWNPPTARTVVDLSTGQSVPPAPPESLAPPATIEDIIREIILKSQTKWRP